MWMDYSTIQMYDNDILTPCIYCRYILVLRGKGNILIDNNAFSIYQHDVIIIPANTSGYFEIKDSSQNSMMLGIIELHDTETSVNINIIPGENTDLIRRVFYLGLDTQEASFPHADMVNSAMHQLMFSVLIAADLKTHIMNPKVYTVINDIDRHFTEVEYDVRPVIEKTGYTPNHFRKLFREETGLTPTEFITLRRLDLSIALFRQFKDRIPVKEIALQCGYQDPYYFSKQFKKRFGNSPQKYVDSLN